MTEFIDKHDEVIKLLAKLKDANVGYPPELLALRRQSYLKRLAQLGVGAGIGIALQQTLKNGGGSVLPVAGPMGKLLEAVLVIAIVVEAGAVAYINRDKLITLFQTISVEPKVEDTSTQPGALPALPQTGLTNTPDATETATPNGTPSPDLFPLATSTNTNSGGNSQVNATPGPKGNNGNQYGHTPKPERIKKPGNHHKNSDQQDPDPKEDSNAG